MMILKSSRQRGDGPRKRSFSFSGKASVSGTRNWGRNLACAAIGRLLHWHPAEPNINPAVADLPRGGGGIGHGIDVS